MPLACLTCVARWKIVGLWDIVVAIFVDTGMGWGEEEEWLGWWREGNDSESGIRADRLKCSVSQMDERGGE